MKIKQIIPLILIWSGMNTAVAVPDTDISIDPVMRQYPVTPLNANSIEQSFTITNTGTGSLTIVAPAIGGLHADQFTISSDTCNGATLTAGSSCTVGVKFVPTSQGTRVARVDIPLSDSRVISGFVTNSEASVGQAKRRMPPVLYSVSIPESMEVNQPHTLSWTLQGYDDNYRSLIAIFNCNGISDNSCGSIYGDNMENSGLIAYDSVTPSAWTYQGNSANDYSYSYTFTPSSATFTQDTQIVIRFYHVNDMDTNAGKNSLSLVIPGNLAGSYYDTEGRRIAKTVCVTGGCTTP